MNVGGVYCINPQYIHTPEKEKMFDGGFFSGSIVLLPKLCVGVQNFTDRWASTV